MNKKDLDYFEKLLRKKREELVKNIEYLRNVTTSSTNQEAAGDHSAYSFHMADQGTDAMEREKAFLFASRDDKYLKQVDAALDRIKDGTYGVCRVTGKDISRERLEAVPTTTISIEAKMQESKTGRPVSDD